MKKLPLKLNTTEKLIYIFAEIAGQKDKFGEKIPIKSILNTFKKDNCWNITEEDVTEAISKIEETGTIFISRGGKTVETIW